jgi:hypothetical protein
MAMRNLGELHGDGHIVLKDGSRTKSADGTLAGVDGVLYAAFEQTRCTLELSDGARVRVIVTGWAARAPPRSWSAGRCRVFDLRSAHMTTAAARPKLGRHYECSKCARLTSVLFQAHGPV